MSKASDYAARVRAAQAKPQAFSSPGVGGTQVAAEVNEIGYLVLHSRELDKKETQDLVNWIQENFDIRAEVTAREQ